MLFREALPRAPKLARRCALACSAALVASAAVVTSVVDVVTPVQAATPLEVSGWAPYFSSNAAASLTAHGSVLSEATPFFYSASATTISTTGTSSQRAAILSAAQASGKPVIATVVDGTAPRGMAGVLADPTQRAAHEQALVSFVSTNNFSGIDLDYENFAFNDGRSTWSDTYTNWGAFVTELGAALHAMTPARTLEVSVPPIYDGGQTTASGYWVYNFPAMNASVDRIKVMMYSYNVSQPGPGAPYNWVSKTMD